MKLTAATLAVYCRQLGLPLPEPEFRFAPPRRWRFDYAWVAEKIAVEVEGGAWISGRHTRGKGFEADCLKYAEAAARGWIVLRFTPKMYESGIPLSYVQRVLEWHGK